MKEIKNFITLKMNNEVTLYISNSIKKITR